MNTLKHLADEVRAGSSLEVELGNFLDAFYLAPHEQRVAEAPELLNGAHPSGQITDALLVAVAEHLCRRFSFRIPEWVYNRSRYLDRPFFALRAIAFRATLLLESPMEFRSRNLFVTANALSRASEYSSARTASLPT